MTPRVQLAAEIEFRYAEFPVGPYSKFYVEFLSQALRAMAYLHEVKIAVHLDFIERNLMVVDEEDKVTKTDGLFPEKFHIGVIDYGFYATFWGLQHAFASPAVGLLADLTIAQHSVDRRNFHIWIVQRRSALCPLGLHKRQLLAILLLHVKHRGSLHG